MKWLIILLSVLTVSVLLALTAAKEPGYVLIVYQDWKVETSLALLVTTLLISGAVGYYLIRTLLGLISAPKRLGQWTRHKGDQRADSGLNRGMLALFEGNWKQAEKLLVKNGQRSHTPLLSYLAAARAAQQQGAIDRRDDYLLKAMQIKGKANIAIGLTQARLQLEQQQLELAQASLENLRTQAPKQPMVLRLLCQLYQQLNEWQQVEDLLPLLKKYRVFSDDEQLKLQHACYLQLLSAHAEKYDYNTLLQLWRRIPKNLHQDDKLIHHYARLLMTMNRQDEAEQILRTTLQKQWIPELLQLYGEVRASKGQQQLNHAEQWLQQHGHDALLFITLGKICIYNQLWGKAKEYLQNAADMGQSEAFELLNNVLQQLGETGLAEEYSQKGLRLIT